MFAFVTIGLCPFWLLLNSAQGLPARDNNGGHIRTSIETKQLETRHVHSEADQLLAQSQSCGTVIVEVHCSRNWGDVACTREQCDEECKATTNCYNVTFPPHSMICELRVQRCQNSIAALDVAVPKASPPSYTALPGNCPDNYIMDDSLTGDDKRIGCLRCTLQECQTSCDQLTACVGFSYSKSTDKLDDTNHQCYLKNKSCTTPKLQTEHIYYQKQPI